MTFANPEFLYLWLLLPILVFLFLYKAKQSSLEVSTISHGKMANLFDYIGYYMPYIIRLLILAALIFIIARPQLGKSFTENKHKGLDILFAIDTSESMSALDLTLNAQTVDRLTALKSILKSFVLKRDKDRLGIIVFGEEAFTQSPLTLDHGAVLTMIDNLHIGMVGKATAIGSAIALSVKRLKDLEAKSKILILMTDGQNTAGDIDPLTAVELAKSYDIKVYTVGIGREGEVPIKVQTPQGPIMVKQKTMIDEELLIDLAESTGGQYYRAQTSADLKKIYENIDKLEKTEIKVKKYNSFIDIYQNFLWFVFFAFMVELFLLNTVFFRF
jgi:Ca-activated chloride channel family protein